MPLRLEEQPGITFSSLSQDVLILILKQIPDPGSLQASVASCRAFYDAYQNSPISISKNLVLRKVNAEVLPEAILLILARNARPVPQYELESTVVQLMGRRNDPDLVASHNWTLADAAGIIRLHSLIEDLANECASFRLAMLGMIALETGNRAHREPPSDSELIRVKRALYRFEINRTLIPIGLDREDYNHYILAAQFAFLETCSPWENEQLASVHRYLFRLVARGTYQSPFHCTIASPTRAKSRY